MKKAKRFVIQGIVQGVFFRKFSKDNAEELNLKGFVRNLENGDVEIIVEGDTNKIEKYREILKKGPPHSQIRNIIAEDKKWSGDFKEFKILRF